MLCSHLPIESESYCLTGLHTGKETGVNLPIKKLLSFPYYYITGFIVTEINLSWPDDST